MEQHKHIMPQSPSLEENVTTKRPIAPCKFNEVEASERNLLKGGNAEMTTAIEQLRQLRRSLPPATAENVDLREEMLNEARKLLLDLEREDNLVERLSFQVGLSI